MMIVSDIMTKDVVSIHPDETVQRAISTMESHNIKEMPVIGDGKLVGMVRFGDIITIVKASPNMKVKNRMIQPPSLEYESEISEAIDLILNTGIEAIPILDKRGKLVGIVSDYDILQQQVGSNVFNQPVGRIMKTEIPFCDEDSSIGDVRKLMDFNKVDRVPVVDENKKFLGMVLQIDILRRFYIQSDTGGRKDLRKGIQRVMSFPVKGVMRQIGRRIRTTDKISDALILMLSENLRGLTILNHDDEPAGLLLRRDILTLLAEEGEEGVLINISGAKLEDFENQKIISLVSEKVNKIYRMEPRIREVKIHLKEVHGSEESEGKYEVDINIIGPRKPIQTESTGFDPTLVIDEMFDNIERILKD